MRVATVLVSHLLNPHLSRPQDETDFGFKLRSSRKSRKAREGRPEEQEEEGEERELKLSTTGQEVPGAVLHMRRVCVHVCVCVCV